MVVVKEGAAHKALVWTVKCKYCGSIIKIIDGDPSVGFRCSYSEHWLEFKCPICEQELDTRYWGDHEETKKFVSREYRTLTLAELEEKESWKK